MAIALTLQKYLDDHRIEYDTVAHAPTLSSMRTAEACHVSGDCLAKGVVLKGDGGYLLAVLPASHHLRLDDIAAGLGTPCELASEPEITTLFADCARGAVPALGAAYGLETLVDDSIDRQKEIYFEGGDHATLVHMSGAQFAEITAGTRHGHFSDEY